MSSDTSSLKLNSIIASNVSANVVSAGVFYGNGAYLSGISKDLPKVANVDIRGNVVGTNISVSGQVNVIGNVTAGWYRGNGALLSGISKDLPKVANIDIRGNVVGTTVIASNVTASVVSAGMLYGNGALLTGISKDLPKVANIDIRGNVVGTNVNADAINADHVIASDVSANVVTAESFIGNGSGLTGVKGLKVGYFYKSFSEAGVINTSSVTTRDDVYVLGKNRTYIIKVVAKVNYVGQTFKLTNIPSISGSTDIPCVAHAVTGDEEVTFGVTSNETFMMLSVEIVEYDYA